MPGGAAGLQNQSGGRKVPGGFDSLPSPPTQGVGDLANYDCYASLAILQDRSKHPTTELVAATVFTSDAAPELSGNNLNGKVSLGTHPLLTNRRTRIHFPAHET